MPRILLPLLLVSISVAAASPASNFPVTTGADSGRGSLRQAILDVNQATDCIPQTPCRITFPPVESSSSPALRIDLQSPLPAVTGTNIRIGPGDVGDSYFFWPVAELHGQGDGIHVEQATNITISGLALIGFPGHGIVVNQSSRIALDAVRVIENGRNGLLIADSGTIAIRGSYIDLNGSNGIYATRSYGIYIGGDFIGTDANNAVLPNAANGIHLDSVHGASLFLSSIRNNANNGLLVTGDSGGNSFEYATFEHNGLLGIDIGNDGPTPANAPVLDSAEFNRGWVRVRGAVHSSPNALVRILTYFSEEPDPSGFGEGAAVVQSRAGTTQVMTGADGDATFTVYFQEFASTVSLHNRYVSVIGTGPGGSSEFSNTLLVADEQPDFFVTNTADSGPGSLRDAIDQLNRSTDCDPQFPCGITFHMAGPPSQNTGVYTISPRTALPVLTRGAAWIDGATQRDFGGDTNSLGPEIEINGSECAGCTGFELRAADRDSFTLVRELTINGFAADGIAAIGDDSYVRIDGCYVGSDSTGTRAVPNGRGIYLENMNGEVGAVFDNRIAARAAAGCVISGNAGDGISIVDGYVRIEGNLIGTDRTGLAPLANGGSGIRSAGTSFVQNNAIAFNRGNGVVVLKPALVNSLYPNRIYANASLGIDIGGDGVTENGTPGVEMAPVIVSARATGNETRVTFRAPSPPPGVIYSTAVTFYASSFADATGRGEGRVVAWETNIFLDGPRNEIDGVIPRNFAGKFIAATATLFDGFAYVGVRTTSEFSNALQVTTGDCPTLTPLILSATTANGDTTLKWSALPGATEYRIWTMLPGDEPKIAYRGADSQTTQAIPPRTEWWVEARFDPCYGTQSEHRFLQP
ncbi:MAG: right-handed parallel beta-helix repeat-containing protein [Thermoanaerobaculia bacterium]